MSANNLAFLFKRSDSGRGNHQRLPPTEMIIIIFILNKSRPTLDFIAYLKRLNSVSVTVSRSLSPPQAIYASVSGYAVQALIEGTFTVMLVSFLGRVKPELLENQ